MDACLIPEVPFTLGGPSGLLAYLDGVLEAQGHTVVCVAEGAGQVRGAGGWVPCAAEDDAWHPRRLHVAVCPGRRCAARHLSRAASHPWEQELMEAEAARAAGLEHAPATGTDASGNPILRDVGPWLKGKFKGHFANADVKLIDPSYIIRSVPATSNDRCGGGGGGAAMRRCSGCSAAAWSAEARCLESSLRRIYCKMLGHGAGEAGYLLPAGVAGPGTDSDSPPAACSARRLCRVHGRDCGAHQQPLHAAPDTRHHPGAAQGAVPVGLCLFCVCLSGGGHRRLPTAASACVES